MRRRHHAIRRKRDGPAGTNIQFKPPNLSSRRSGADPPDHVIVVGGLADLMPLVLFVAERDGRFIQRLESTIAFRNEQYQWHQVCKATYDNYMIRRIRA